MNNDNNTNKKNQGSRGEQDGGGTENRGFASMDPEKQREIASMGGKAAHEKGTAHEFDSDEAREAGRKGGQSRGQNSGNSSDGNSGSNSGGSNR